MKLRHRRPRLPAPMAPALAPVHFRPPRSRLPRHFDARLKNDTLGGMAPPLNFKKGQPNPINCWYWMKVSHGAFTTPYGLKATCSGKA